MAARRRKEIEEEQRERKDFVGAVKQAITEDLENIGLDKVHQLEQIYGRDDLRVKRAKLDSFFRAYAILGTVRYSCQVCGLKYKVIKDLVKRHDKYRRKFEEAHIEFCEYLEQTAIVRALRKSDTLLTFLLRANNPKKFSERLRLQGLKDEEEGPVSIVFGEATNEAVSYLDPEDHEKFTQEVEKQALLEDPDHASGE